MSDACKATGQRTHGTSIWVIDVTSAGLPAVSSWSRTIPEV
jgi:hypothetical protein